MSDGKDLFLIFVAPLNRLGAQYMVTGSAASMAYGIPRVTLDIDMVLSLTATQAGLLPSAFPAPEFYCPPREVIDLETERPFRGHFNIIHMETGFKADLYLVGDDPFHSWGMERRCSVEMSGETVMLAPPEYVIVRKLEYFKEGGSEKHIRDIRGMLDVSDDSIDGAELEDIIRERGLEEPWSRVNELRL